MLFSHTYLAAARPAEAVYKEKGSRFIAFAFPVTSEEAFKKELDGLKKKFPDATHHCYALVLHHGAAFQKSSDDGEPSNTAGKPILRAILSARLTNTAVIVVRYFGGIQLGVPGLIHAYGEAASLALQQAGTQEYILYRHYMLECGPEQEGEAHRFLKKLQAGIELKDYGEQLKIHFKIPLKDISMLDKLSAEFYFLKITPLS